MFEHGSNPEYGRGSLSLPRKHILSFETASVILLALVMLISGLQSTPLARATEPRVAGVAAGMYLTGDYVAPRLNGTLFLEKPPLHPWLTGLSFELFGINNVSARLVSVGAAIATLLLLINFLRRRDYSASVASLAAVSLLTMAQYWSYARLSGQDALLALGVALCAMSTFEHSLRPALRSLLLITAGVAIASLTKGIFGVAMCAGIVGGYLVLKQWLIDKRFSLKQLIVVMLAALIGLIPLCLWLFALYRQEGWEALMEEVWTNSVDRFNGTYQRGAHIEPWYFYFAKIPTLFQPWLVMIGFGLYFHFKKTRLDALRLFSLCWLLVPVFMLSLSTSKRTEYLLSIYPAAAIVLASVFRQFFAAASDQLSPGRRKTLRNLLIFQALLTFLALAYCAVETVKLHNIELRWLPLLILAIPLCLYAGLQTVRNQLQRALVLTTLALYLGFIYFGATINTQLSAKRSMEAMFQTLQRDNPDTAMALYKPKEKLSGGAVFYLHKTIPELNARADFDSYAANHDHYIVISEDKELGNYPGSVSEFKLKYDRFYLLKK